MRLNFFKLFLSLAIVVFGCVNVEEAPVLDLVRYDEDEDRGQLEMNLTWKVNGAKDDGMIADMQIYLSESDWDYTELDESLSAVNISSFDFIGGRKVVPSTRNLYDFNRYFIGIAFNGILPTTQSLTYPLTITYSFNLFLSNEPTNVKIITGEFVITNSNFNTTIVEYPYTMDILESEQDAEYRSYILHQLETPILLSRVSDVETTDTFSADKSLYIEMVWKVNGAAQGFKKADLDLYLHDINDTNVSNSDDLDFYSHREDSYERIIVDPSSTYFNASIPEKIGFYPYELMSTGPIQVEYMYKVYSYESKIKRFTAYESFTFNPLLENNGNFYFGVDIVKSGTNYKVTKLGSVVQWKP